MIHMIQELLGQTLRTVLADRHHSPDSTTLYLSRG